MFAKGRGARGEGQWFSKLTEADVQAIRASGECLGVLAKRYGVITATISNVLRHSSWKHVAGVRQTRELRGEDAFDAILTEDDVYDIRASNDSLNVLAARFGVTRSNIWMIKHRRSWKHLEEDPYPFWR